MRFQPYPKGFSSSLSRTISALDVTQPAPTHETVASCRTYFGKSSPMSPLSPNKVNNVLSSGLSPLPSRALPASAEAKVEESFERAIQGRTPSPSSKSGPGSILGTVKSQEVAKSNAQSDPMDLDAPASTSAKEEPRRQAAAKTDEESLGAALDVLANIAGMVAVKPSPEKAKILVKRPPHLNLAAKNDSNLAKTQPIINFMRGNKAGQIQGSQRVLIAPRRLPHLTKEHRPGQEGDRIGQRQQQQYRSERMYSLQSVPDASASSHVPRTVPRALSGSSTSSTVSQRSSIDRRSHPMADQPRPALPAHMSAQRRYTPPPSQRRSSPPMKRSIHVGAPRDHVPGPNARPLPFSHAHVFKMSHGKCPMYNCSGKLVDSELQADVMNCQQCSRVYWRHDEKVPLSLTCCPLYGCAGRVVIAEDPTNGTLHGCSVCRLVFQQVKRSEKPSASKAAPVQAC